MRFRLRTLVIFVILAFAITIEYCLVSDALLCASMTAIDTPQGLEYWRNRFWRDGGLSALVFIAAVLFLFPGWPMSFVVRREREKGE
jgi:hypothetical protein